ncbi:hypothetical protein K2173_022066 [Erythroxylum novogranatense]|uniref:Peptidyl-prolyl cis-trans isomerase n=1 Tax=Erythroxylum novogranatense TaxID=1862640 RepID=A0AAV8T437_9ROSI|nr:hypothetical protein K2173_022066 [Erythroxylum novogranatense]
MGKDSKQKDSGGKDNEKQAGDGSDENASKGKGKLARVMALGLALMSKLAAEYSECQYGKKGRDLGWFRRGKMASPFQDVAFSAPIGATSAPFKSTQAASYGMTGVYA